MTECVFCKIISGAIPSEKVFEDDHSVAFLDINPIAPGHTLLLCKPHHETIAEIPADLLRVVAANIKVVSSGVVRATGCDGFNVLQNNHACAGQAIPHLHFHIIPRKTGDTIRFNWQPRKYGPGEIQKMGSAVRDGLKKNHH